MKRRLLIIWASLALTAMAFIALGWGWKRPFIFGDAAGAYWLLIAYDWSAPILAGLALLAVIALVIVWGVNAALRRPARAWAGAAGVALPAFLAFAVAAFPAIVSPTTPLEAVRVEGRVYYLAAHAALVDVNFGLFECGNMGIVCRQVFRSHDFSPSDARASLDHDPGTLEVRVLDGDGQTIYARRFGETAR